MNGHEGAYDSHARVAVAPSRPQVVYKTVETPLALFYILRSEDGGETWRRIGEGNDVATALHVDPHDPDRAIVGFNAFKGNGLLVTSDGGATWKRVRRDAPPTGIAADPRDGDRLWLTDANGLHRSTDGGATFTRRFDQPLGAVALDPDDPERLIAGGARLYVSEDGGETLRPAFYADLELAIQDVVFDPVRPRVAYAAAACSSASGCRAAAAACCGRPTAAAPGARSPRASTIRACTRWRSRATAASCSPAPRGPACSASGWLRGRCPGDRLASREPMAPTRPIPQ